MELFIYYISHPVQHFLNFLEFLKSIFFFIITPIVYIFGFVVLCFALWICLTIVLAIGYLVITSFGILFGVNNPINIKEKDDFRSKSGGLLMDNLRIERIHVWLVALSTISLIIFFPSIGWTLLLFSYFSLSPWFNKLINFFKKKKKE